MTTDHVYLIHIADCIRRIRVFTTGGESEFLSDLKTQDAVIRNLQVLAESTQRLSVELRTGHPEIPWDQLTGFRNVMVHGYLDIQLDKCWAVIAKDLDPLEKAINEMAQAEGLI